MPNNFSFILLFLIGGLATPVLLRAQEAPVVADSSTVLQGVVVTASRGKENVLQAPVSIEKLTAEQMRESAQPSFFDAIENVKGIQVLVPSLGFKVINARGFTNTTNVRFVQMVDGLDIQAPHIGAPMADALGPSDLDISGVEIVPGSASALYGMNAINGSANFLTKDPFISQGLSMSQKAGVNHLGDAARSPAFFTATALRWAKAYQNKLAFKINAVYTQGVDWYADNRADLNPNANSSTGLTGSQNPGKDLVNIYADESSNRRTLTLGDKQYIVSRTGYAEKDMSGYDLQNIKADATLAYRLNGSTTISYTYRVAHTNTIYQRTNRFRLDDYITRQHSVILKSSSVQFRAYVNGENTGNSYNIRSMAENMDRRFKSDNAWFADFSSQYNSAIRNSGSVTVAMQEARAFADHGRPEPHTAPTDALIDKLRDINNWDSGAALRVKASMYHAEIQHNLTDDVFKKFSTRYHLSIMYGVDFRQYVVVPDGNYFINPVKAGSNLLYWKTGGFVQGSKSLFRQKLKVSGVLRIDKNQYFDPKLNTRLALVYSPAAQHNMRMAVQQGYRFPSLFEAFSNINSGGVRRVGGLPVMSHGIFENSYFRASIDAFQAANTADVNQNGLSNDQAIQKNKGLLKRNDYTYLEPEQVEGLETGYRGSLWNGKLTIDIDFYYNVYHNLMAQVEANIPKQTVPDSLYYYLNDRQKQDRYRLWTNSKTVSYNFGGTVGVIWYLPKSYQLGGNATLAKLDRKAQNDGLEDGFNTPAWACNLSFSNPALSPRFGFGLNFRWQSRYLWQSSLATGWVSAYHTVDAQVRFWAIKEKVNVKLGASNILNRYYYSFIGGPAVGGFYYLTTTCNLF